MAEHRKRLHVKIDAKTHNALKIYSEAEKTTMGAVVDTALCEFLTGEDYRTTSLQFLADLLHQTNENQQRINEVHELVGRAVLVFLNRCSAPDESKADTKQAYSQFLESIADHLGQNKTVAEALDNLSR